MRRDRDREGVGRGKGEDVDWWGAFPTLVWGAQALGWAEWGLTASPGGAFPDRDSALSLKAAAAKAVAWPSAPVRALAGKAGQGCDAFVSYGFVRAFAGQSLNQWELEISHI